MSFNSPSSSGSLCFGALLDSTSNECHYLFEDNNVIGRLESAFITIKSEVVSRSHCRIDKEHDYRVTIRDLGSVHGTFVNGNKLKKGEVRMLCHNDRICLAAMEEYTFLFKFNPKFKLAMEKSESVSSRFKEKLVNLDTSHSGEMEKLTQQMNDIATERCVLKQEFNRRLDAQEYEFKQDRLRLSNLVNTSIDEKVDAEKKLKEMEEKFFLEKKVMMEDMERKINEGKEKELDLQEMRNKMEQQYLQERRELEEKCKLEIEELKERLAESEMEHGRLKEENLEVELKLKETERNLLESEKEQFRLHQEKVNLGSKIDDLTQEKTSQSEMVKFLEQKLHEKVQAEEKMKKEMEDLEEELQCSICVELFIEPTVLNCGHMFCKVCIDGWKKNKKVCPMCRAKITSCVRIYTMDSIIDKNARMLSSDAKTRRDAIIQERKGEKSAVPPKKRKNSHHHHPHNLHRAQVEIAIHYSPTTSRTATNTRTGTLDNQFFNNVIYPNNPQQQPTPSTSRGFNPFTGTNAGHNPPVVLGNTFPQELSDPDPFAWAARDNRQPYVMLNEMRPLASPVTVAAIDLTNVPTPVSPAPGPSNAWTPRTRSATVALADTTIDLTTP